MYRLLEIIPIAVVSKRAGHVFNVVDFRLKAVISAIWLIVGKMFVFDEFIVFDMIFL